MKFKRYLLFFYVKCSRAENGEGDSDAMDDADAMGFTIDDITQSQKDEGWHQWQDGAPCLAQDTEEEEEVEADGEDENENPQDDTAQGKESADSEMEEVD